MQSFTKNNTLALKGIAILLMTWGHLFSYVPLVNYNVDLSTLKWYSSNFQLISFLSGTCRICVIIFAFLSAYAYQIGIDKTGKRSESRYAIYKIIKLQLFYLPMFLLSFLIVWIKNKNMLIECYGEGKQGIINICIDGLGIRDYLGTPTFNSTWWYISFAYLLIIVVPVWSKWYKSEKLLALLLPLALCAYLIQDNNSFNSWMLSDLIIIPVGIMFADKNLFLKIANLKLLQHHVINKILKMLVYGITIVIFLYIRKGYGFVYITDPALAVIVALLYYEYIAKIKWLDQILMFLGKYSRDMWLCQVAVLLIALQNYIYKFDYPIIIFIVALLITVFVSIATEWIEKKTRYSRIADIIALAISGYRKK